MRSRFRVCDEGGMGLLKFDFDELSSDDWRLFLSSFEFDESVLRKYSDKLKSCWTEICKYQKLSEEFMCEFKDDLRWHEVSRFQSFSDDFIEKMVDKISFYTLCKNRKLSLNTLTRFRDKVDLYSQITDHQFNDDELCTLAAISPNYIDVMCRSQKLSEEFMRKFADRLSWYNVSQHQVLSEEFIRDNADRVDWRRVCQYQKLSEELMNDFAHKINGNWDIVAEHQTFSYDFVLRHCNVLDERILRKNVNIDRKSFPYGFWKIFKATKKLSS